MTKKELKELRLLLLTVQMKQAADKRVTMPFKTNGMEKKRGYYSWLKMLSFFMKAKLH